MAIKVDNIIIGAGPGGYELASMLASRGETVVVAERDNVGGTCLNRGCIPTKSLCATAAAILRASECTSLGVSYGNVNVDFRKAMDHLRTVVSDLRSGVEGLLSKCTVLRSEARFTGRHTVMIGTDEYEARRIVIASGSRPAMLDVEGAELAITSDEALWIDSLPESVAIIGGGVIGMELASVFAAMGAKVTVLEYRNEILPGVDPDVAKRLRVGMTRRGVEIAVGASVKRLSPTDGDSIRIEYENKKGVSEVVCSTAVMAVGRRAVIPEGFERFGGELDGRGFIRVDKRMMTSIDGVYAVGDVNGILMLAHAAYAQGRVVANDDPSLFDVARVPSVVFTYPEIACVGIVEQDEAVRTVKRMFASNGKACAEGLTDGFVKFSLRADDSIAAVSIYGHHAADLIAEAAILVKERVPLGNVGCRYVHAHPTLSELFVGG